MDDPRESHVRDNVKTEEHTAISKKVAADSMILLKNENSALPFDDSVKQVLMIGSQLGNPIIVGGGSGSVHLDTVKSPLDAMCEKLGVPKIDKDVKCPKISCGDNACVVYNPDYVTN